MTLHANLLCISSPVSPWLKSYQIPHFPEGKKPRPLAWGTGLLKPSPCLPFTLLSLCSSRFLQLWQH